LVAASVGGRHVSGVSDSHNSSPTRRTFLATFGAATLGLATGRRAFGASDSVARPRAKLSRIGLELYTVRREAAADLAGTLARVAKIGYEEVEFAGYHNHSAADVRDLLKQNGLTAPAAHIDIAAIQNSPDKTFTDARTIGHEWIVVPSLPSGKRATVDDWKRVADLFNATAKQVKAAGFRFGFHNHNDVFRKIDEVMPIDVLMTETDPSLVSYEMDVYWVVNGGGDPVDLLSRYPDRFRLLHLKDSMGPPDHKMADVGSGTIDFKAVLAHAKGIEHYFVEHDNPPDAFTDVAASYSYLSKLEY
jgi:sugar phosphate isomerase/epimerase